MRLEPFPARPSFFIITEIRLGLIDSGTSFIFSSSDEARRLSLILFWITGPITWNEQFAKLCGVDLKKELVVGCTWYGFASGGSASVPMPERKRSVDDVLMK